MNTPHVRHSARKFRPSTPGNASTIYPCALTPGSNLAIAFPAPGEQGCDDAGVTFPSVWFFPVTRAFPTSLTNTYYKAFASSHRTQLEPELAMMAGSPS